MPYMASLNTMNTLIFLALLPFIGFIIAFYLDSQKPKRDLKEKKKWEKVLGKDFNLEDITAYHIKNFGKNETKSNFNNIVSYMNRIGKNTSISKNVYQKYFEDK